MWDTASHQHKMINGEMGDIACDSYHRFREDIKLLKKLKVKFDMLYLSDRLSQWAHDGFARKPVVFYCSIDTPPNRQS